MLPSDGSDYVSLACIFIMYTVRYKLANKILTRRDEMDKFRIQTGKWKQKLWYTDGGGVESVAA